MINSGHLLSIHFFLLTTFLRYQYLLIITCCYRNCSHSLKQCNYLADDSDKNIAINEREGRLKNLLKKTYLKRWMGNDRSQHDTDIYGSSSESNSTNKKDYKSMDFARFIVMPIILY